MYLADAAAPPARGEHHSEAITNSLRKDKIFHPERRRRGASQASLREGGFERARVAYKCIAARQQKQVLRYGCRWVHFIIF